MLPKVVFAKFLPKIFSFLECSWFRRMQVNVSAGVSIAAKLKSGIFSGKQKADWLVSFLSFNA